MAASAKALFFDVFGTLVDWRNGIARESKLILEPLGFSLDWLAFADAWRDQYQPGMEEVRSGRIPFSKLDVLHRRNLERILPRFGISGLSEDAARNLNLAWHRLDAWPDVPPGMARLKRRVMLAPVSNGNISLMVAPEQSSVGRDPGFRDRRRLQAEAAGLSRRLRGARPAARRMHDGGGPHQRSAGGGQVRAAHRPRGAAERERSGHRRSRAEGVGRRCGEQPGRSGDQAWRLSLSMHS